MQNTNQTIGGSIYIDSVGRIINNVRQHLMQNNQNIINANNIGV